MALIRAAARQTVIDHDDLKTHCVPLQIELAEGMVKAMHQKAIASRPTR